MPGKRSKTQTSQKSKTSQTSQKSNTHIIPQPIPLKKKKISISNIEAPQTKTLLIKQGLELTNNQVKSLNPFNHKLHENYDKGYIERFGKLRSMFNTAINTNNKTTTSAIRPSTQVQISEIQKRAEEIRQKREKTNFANSKQTINKSSSNSNKTKHDMLASESLKFTMNMPPNITNHMTQYIDAQEQIHQQKQNQIKSKNKAHVIKIFDKADAEREYIRLHLKSKYIPTENNLASGVKPLQIPMPILAPPPGFENSRNEGYGTRPGTPTSSRPGTPTSSLPTKLTRYGPQGSDQIFNQFGDYEGSATYVGGNYSHSKNKKTLKNHKTY